MTVKPYKIYSSTRLPCLKRVPYRMLIIQVFLLCAAMCEINGKPPKKQNVKNNKNIKSTLLSVMLYDTINIYCNVTAKDDTKYRWEMETPAGKKSLTNNYKLTITHTHYLTQLTISNITKEYQTNFTTYYRNKLICSTYVKIKDITTEIIWTLMDQYAILSVYPIFNTTYRLFGNNSKFPIIKRKSNDKDSHNVLNFKIHVNESKFFGNYFLYQDDRIIQKYLIDVETEVVKVSKGEHYQFLVKIGVENMEYKLVKVIKNDKYKIKRTDMVDTGKNVMFFEIQITPGTYGQYWLFEGDKVIQKWLIKKRGKAH